MRICFILFCMSFCAFAQDTYQLEGSLGTIATTKEKIKFTLTWTEKEKIASGSYSDNFYTDSAKFKGIAGSLGRIFMVTLPKEVNGVRTITFLGPSLNGSHGAALIPMSVILRDSSGTPTSTKSIEANLIGLSDKRVAQKQEERLCEEGFGKLAGYCGEYTGMISEELDTQIKCDILKFSGTRLIFDENGEVGLALGESSSIIAIPIHRIGRIFTDPESTRIDLMSRKCHSLSGVAFPSDNCKRLNLSGSFSTVNNVKHFSGDYSIIDEETNAKCRYNFSMDVI